MLTLTICRGFNAAFGENSASMADVSATVAQQSPPLFQSASTYLQSHTPMNSGIPQPYSIPPSIPPLPRSDSNAHISASSGMEPSFVTSHMFRESIANTYDRSALKRGWDQTSYLGDPMQAKRIR